MVAIYVCSRSYNYKCISTVLSTIILLPWQQMTWLFSGPTFPGQISLSRRGTSYFFVTVQFSFSTICYYFDLFIWTIWKWYIIFKLTYLKLFLKMSAVQQDTAFYCGAIDGSNSEKRYCYWNGFRPTVTDFLHRKAILAYVDNCANSHICNDKNMFISLTEINNPSRVETVGGVTYEVGVGTVR